MNKDKTQKRGNRVAIIISIILLALLVIYAIIF